MRFGFTAIIPADNRVAANSDIETQGHGPNSFNTPAGRGSHALFHCWNSPQSVPLKTYLQSIAATYGIVIDDAPAERPTDQVQAMCTGLAIEWPPAQDWLDNLPQTGDVRTFDGVEWRALQDNLVWGPDADPVNWERVTPLPGNEWQPNVAYSVGDEVTYEGLTYRCLQAHTSLSVWQPPVVPALWQAI